MRLYRIIYDCIEEIESAMKGMLAPKYREVFLGKAECREVYKITNVGMVIGGHVTSGKIVRGAQVRLCVTASSLPMIRLLPCAASRTT